MVKLDFTRVVVVAGLVIRVDINAIISKSVLLVNIFGLKSRNKHKNHKLSLQVVLHIIVLTKFRITTLPLKTYVVCMFVCVCVCMSSA